ncbi:hypothetical protein BN159_3313 [Streptomyces davaonensis JCM 4913]|uniref:DUF4190 domain-containing protein n=1 Tax=Streptomyces davaonensis (strain DSM 101723 / JCM 4913 / KCC S-0913 / 768) TaxID=1214101 RepID=K4R3H2_STRDJ|nr:DUF4190 domain-containing protein [Streptomyces davaonensis]CCK27692.1 hypothetical protein BN159_3313 [Streptomyces davaonensis JCM 4913]
MSIPPPHGPHQPYGPQEPPGPYGPYPQGQFPPQGPYAPYPYHPYGPYGRPAPVNGVAIAALVLGILCFLPAVGLVLGLVALAQIKKKGERGRGMAIAGSVLSCVGLVLWTVTLTTGIASDTWDTLKDAAGQDGTAYSLAKGDCFDSPTGSLEGATYDVEEVPCAGRHDGEVFAVITLPGGRFPGDDSVTATAEDKCYTLQAEYAMDPWAVPEDATVYYLVPSSQSWRFGDREITCLFGNTDENGTLTGSLRNDETTLDADQIAFLKAMNTVDDVLFEEPEDFPEDDLPANRAWAKDVEGVLGEQIEALEGHGWKSAAEDPVADLLADMKDARTAWAKAAGTDDVDTFYEHYDTGYEYVDGPTTVTAREALGLATTVPSYDGEYEGGDESPGGDELDV